MTAPALLAPDEIIVNCFAGGGGVDEGIRMRLGRSSHIAINHDEEAIAMHAVNHPDAEHYPKDIWNVDPREVCRGRPVGLLWLSPDCTHFSKAKGSKPVSKKIRALAWVAIRWAAAVHPRVIILENVEEFQGWGPVSRKTQKPDPARKGQTFRAFVRKLRRHGYEVEWRELRACDFGAPTIRKRFFLIARRDGLPIVWPKPTHGKHRAQTWRTAAECIEWSIPCPSIFLTSAEAKLVSKALGIGRIKRPLEDATLRRIARGIRKFVIDSPRPFIVGVGGRAGQSPERHLDQPYQTVTSKADASIVIPHITKFREGSSGSAIDEPMPTVTANSFIKRPGGAAPLGIVAPHLMSVTQQGERKPIDPTEPAPTITGAHRGEIALIAPTLIQSGYGEDKHRNGGEGQPPRALDIEAPLGTVVSQNVKHALVSAFLAKHYGGHETPGGSLHDPMSTLTTQDHHHLVAAHIAKFNGDRVGSSAEDPLHTVIADGVHHSVVASSLVNMRGTDDSQIGGRSIEEPLPTISAGGIHAAEVRAFLIAYYGTKQNTGALQDPIPTVTSNDRFGLVTVHGQDYFIADIGMRMLTPRELFRAQGFPDSYIIDAKFFKTVKPSMKYPNGVKLVPLSKTAQVKMAGNAVPPQFAAALVGANLCGDEGAMDDLFAFARGAA